jgi:tripartite-type tricarboxylate transporter receptor subunit TctC
MKRTIRLVSIAVAAIFFLLYGTDSAQSQGFPSKPVTVIVPAPPGGTADISMRIIAHRLTENLGQQVIVDNRPGAGGVIASQLAVKATPDGYTMLMNYTSHAINPSLYKKLPYDSTKDFIPVTLLGVTPLVLVVHPSVPAKTVPEFIAFAKANPGKLNYGSAAIGGASHMGGELLKIKAGIDIVHVPYKGGAAAVADLISGQIQMGLDSLLVMQPHIKAGKVRPLGVTNLKRTEISPNLPAIAETIPNYEANAWFGIMTPASTPKEAVARLNTEFTKVLRTQETREKLTQQGFEAVGNSSEEYTAFLKKETEKWAEVVRIAGVKVE